MAYMRFPKMKLALNLPLNCIIFPPDTMESCKERINVRGSCIGREEWPLMRSQLYKPCLQHYLETHV